LVENANRFTSPTSLPCTTTPASQYKKHLKNVGPIRHCEPPHAHSPGVATVATVARRLCIDVHDNADANDDDDNDNNDNDNA